jgi:hypothetical protein
MALAFSCVEGGTVGPGCSPIGNHSGVPRFARLPTPCEISCLLQTLVRPAQSAIQRVPLQGLSERKLKNSRLGQLYVLPNVAHEKQVLRFSYWRRKDRPTSASFSRLPLPMHSSLPAALGPACLILQFRKSLGRDQMPLNSLFSFVSKIIKTRPR